jgi:hypothetical protein
MEKKMSNVIMLPDHDLAPLLSEKMDTPFVQELTSAREMTVNGRGMSPAIWNLLVSHRDLKLWCNLKMKPHRGWKVTDCKRYFGLSGSGSTLLAQFEALKAEVDRLMALKDEDN